MDFIFLSSIFLSGRSSFPFSCFYSCDLCDSWSPHQSTTRTMKTTNHTNDTN